MSGSGVPNDDMANYLRPRRQDTPQFSDAALGALLSGAEPPAPGLQPVADVLDALKSSPSRNELAGEAAALAEFRRGAQTRAPAHRSWAGLFTSRLSARAAAVAVAAVLGLGGFAGAAYAGILPSPIQRFAHDTIDAPAPSAKPGSASPGTRLAGRPRHRAGAAPSRHPLPGLCAAYARASAHGTAAQRARALHNLASAAGGASKIPAYCRNGPVPGERRGQHQPHPPGEGKGHGSGQGKGGGQGNGHGPGQGDGSGHGPGQGDGNGNGPGHGNGNSQVTGNGGGQGNGQGPGSGHGQGPGNGNGSANGQGNGQHHGNAIGHGKGKADGEAGGQSQGNQSAQRATVSPLRPRAQQSFTRHRTVTPRPQLGRVEPPHRSEGWRWQAVR